MTKGNKTKCNRCKREITAGGFFQVTAGNSYARKKGKKWIAFCNVCARGRRRIKKL